VNTTLHPEKSYIDSVDALKAPIADPVFTGTVSGVTKAHVGLGSVDNTSDTAKPVSTAQQTALDLKAPTANPTFTGTVAGVTKAHVGLGSVDNTSDTAKPVSTATQTALNLKAPSTNPTFSGNGVMLANFSVYSALDAGGDLTVGGSMTSTGHISANGGKLRTTAGNTFIRGLTVNGSSDADPILIASASGAIRLNRNLEALGNITGGGDISVDGAIVGSSLSTTGTVAADSVAATSVNAASVVSTNASFSNAVFGGQTIDQKSRSMIRAVLGI
jgi:hypothetical protein